MVALWGWGRPVQAYNGYALPSTKPLQECCQLATVVREGKARLESHV